MVTLNRPVSPGVLGRKPDRERDARVARMFNEGKTIQEIAVVEGVSWSAVQGRLKRIEREAAEAEGEAQV